MTFVTYLLLVEKALSQPQVIIFFCIYFTWSMIEILKKSSAALNANLYSILIQEIVKNLPN